MSSKLHESPSFNPRNEWSDFLVDSLKLDPGDLRSYRAALRYVEVEVRRRLWDVTNDDVDAANDL